jgi:hypothetical protein
MEGREKPRVVKYKAITNDWSYDTSCTLTSLPVCDLKIFKRLVFVVQSVLCMLHFQILQLELSIFVSVSTITVSSAV